VKNLDAAPQLEPEADELRQRLKGLLLRTREAGAIPSPASAGKNKTVATTTLTQDFVAWRKEYNQWLKTGARNYSGLDQIETK
jgi:hypothetical protein